MKIKIHWEVNEIKDSIVIEFETESEIMNEIERIKRTRGLDVKTNNMWSENI